MPFFFVYRRLDFFATCRRYEYTIPPAHSRSGNIVDVGLRRPYPQFNTHSRYSADGRVDYCG